MFHYSGLGHEKIVNTWVRAHSFEDPLIITRFIAGVETATGSVHSFAAFGLPRQDGAVGKLGEPFVHGEQLDNYTTPVTNLFVPNVSDWVIPSCFTTVRLTGDIKRISISSGLPGRSRNVDHISGRRFDFFSSNIPVFVGQWFNEIASMRLQTGDRVIGLRYWSTRCIRWDTSQPGCMVGIEIITTTADGQYVSSLQVLPGGEQGEPEFGWFESDSEQLASAATLSASVIVGLLTVQNQEALVWDCSSNEPSDTVDAVTRPASWSHPNP